MTLKDVLNCETRKMGHGFVLAMMLDQPGLIMDYLFLLNIGLKRIKMQRVERHIIVKDENLDKICFLSKNLYNYVNFILRQAHLKKFDQIPEYQHLIKSFKIKDKEYFEIKEFDLVKELTKQNQIDYRMLSSQCSQQTIKLLYKNWKSFYSLLRNRNKLNEIPKIPKYKDKGGKNIVIFTKDECRIKEDGCVHFCKKSNLKPIKTKVKKGQLNQVRIIPQSSCYVVEIVYTKEKQELDLNENLYLSIDLGINNLATCVNNADQKSFIINGRVVKSINQHYNKKSSKLKSLSKNKSSKRIKRLCLKRSNKIYDYFHKTSRFIINYCIENKIKNIIVGYNKEWKQEVSLGKVNNQKFVQIPYLKLVEQLKYKGEEVGIQVILNEESYTSKCDSLALEELKQHKSYLGKRIKRGLFQSSVGKIINADVNAAINIMRKVVDDSLVKEIINRGLVFNPMNVVCS